MSSALKASTTVAKVLVIEADEPTRKLLAERLEADRFDAVGAATVEVARATLAHDEFDLVLIDLTLKDGLALLGEIQQSETSPGVIVLTGRGTERDRVRAIADGASDYIQRPFSYGELLARMNLVLKKRKGLDRITKAGEIEIDNVTDRVTVAGREVRLSKKELALLKVLAEEPERAFSFEELLRKVWGYRAIGHTRTLEAHLSRLRAKLDPETRCYVQNCWGVAAKLLPFQS